MEATGKIADMARDFTTNKVRITFVIDTLPSDIDVLTGCDVLDITAKRHRERRSLSANAYFHKLCALIGGAIGAPNTEVKNRLIREYGAYEFVDEQIPTIRIKAEYESEILNREGWHFKPIGYEVENDSEWVRMALMRGSHTYDTKEMTRLIDGAVEEAKELGIETMPPDEIARMEASWEPQK
mgnify:FL=1